MLVRESHLGCDDASLVFDVVASSFDFTILHRYRAMVASVVAAYLIVFVESARITSTAFRMRLLY